MSDKQQPEDTLRDGTLKATIWGNPSEHGLRYNTEYTRSFRNNDGDWQETHTMRERDNAPLSQLSARAHNRIQEIKQERNRAQNQEREDHKSKRTAQSQSRTQNYSHER